MTHTCRRILAPAALMALAFCTVALAADPPPAAKPAPPASASMTGADAMAHAHEHDAPVASPAAAMEPREAVSGQEVSYGTVNGEILKGYLARPTAAKGPLPGLIVIHEWWGLNDNIRAMTRRLAGEGYAALAVDLYHGKAGADPDSAQKLMKASMGETAALQENLKAAHAYLTGTEKASRVGAIGWCFGGGWSLQTALLLGDQLQADVMYYGRQTTDPADLAKLKAPLLGFFGAEDKAFPVADVRAFEAALEAAGKDATIKIYDGAGHAFANPSGQGYRAEPAADSWAKTVDFFAKHLKK